MIETVSNPKFLDIGSDNDQIVFITKIPTITNGYPFEFKIVLLSFVMSINKTQGQTMEVAGIDNTDPCLTQDQF